jgi:hypothetical protein
MRPGLPTLAAFGAAALAALTAAHVVERFGPSPSADVARGSEDAFASLLQPREFVGTPKRPQRWTGGRAVFRFRHLPSGPLTLGVRLHSHRGPVRVAAGGRFLGVLDVGGTAGDYRVPTFRGGTLEVDLRPETFVAGDGRRLGALLDGVTVAHERRAWPGSGLFLCLLVPTLTAVAAGLAAGLARRWAALAGAVSAALQTLALWPSGLFRSEYAAGLAGLVVGGHALAAALAAWARRRRAGGAGPWCFAAVGAAFWVHGVAATSPLMVVSDAVFHAHKLGEVAGGNWFPTSETQHARPFRFPYGVAFYAPLVPLHRAGVDGVLLVRAGAAVAGLLASVGLYWLLAADRPKRAALAVVLLQLFPITVDVHAYGNFSNVFGQALTVLFFAWWSGRLAGPWPVGAALLVLGALSHLSTFIVLAALGLVLAVVGRGEPARERRRPTALVVGLGLAAAYYLSFTGLVLEQLPRFLEGGGSGRLPQGPLQVLWGQVRAMSGQWGLPVVGLVVAAWAGRRGRPERESFERALLAFWLAGLALAALAVVSPLEVRYLYALTLPLAIAASGAAFELAEAGRGGFLLAAGLVALQAVVGVSNLVDAVARRYRL